MATPTARANQTGKSSRFETRIDNRTIVETTMKPIQVLANQ